MTVSYAQFVIEYPEFSEVEQTMVEPVLTTFDAFYDGFGDTIHDQAIYARTALHLSDSPFGMRMSDESTEQNRYIHKWLSFLVLCPKRGHVSGGLT
jgi:hypothetical protein